MFGALSRWFGRVRKVNVSVYGVGGGLELEPPKVDADEATRPITEIKLVGDMTVAEAPDEGVGNVWHIVANLKTEHSQTRGTLQWTLTESPAHPRSKEIGKAYSEDVNGFLETRGEDRRLTLRGSSWGISWTMTLSVKESCFEGSYKDQKYAGTVHGGATLIRAT